MDGTDRGKTDIICIDRQTDMQTDRQTDINDKIWRTRTPNDKHGKLATDAQSKCLPFLLRTLIFLILCIHVAGVYLHNSVCEVNISLHTALQHQC